MEPMEIPAGGRDVWDGINLPLILQETQMGVDRVAFTGNDFLALQNYVQRFGLRDTFEAMLKNGWDRERAINVLRIVHTQMPESPLK